MKDNIASTLHLLKQWADFCFDNHDLFLKNFTTNGWILTEVSWNDELMYFVYILREGQHVSDGAPMKDWLEFFNANAQKQ